MKSRKEKKENNELDFDFDSDSEELENEEADWEDDDSQPKKTLIRADIVDAIVGKFKISKFEAAEIVEAIIEEISETLRHGEEVKLAKFGTFYTRDKKERMGRNPKTKEDAVITSRRSVSFRPSPVFRDAVNKQHTR